MHLPGVTDSQLALNMTEGMSTTVGLVGAATGIEGAMQDTEAYVDYTVPVSYTHLRAHETDSYLVCRLLLEKKKGVFCLTKKNNKKRQLYTSKRQREKDEMSMMSFNNHKNKEQ